MAAKKILMLVGDHVEDYEVMVSETKRRSLYLALVLLAFLASAAQADPVLDLQCRAWFYGRDYFVLRSGRAQMIVQADRADLGPAFTYLLFDAENPGQSARKDRAFNFLPGEGFASSGLRVELGGHRFEALGQHTQTRWVSEDGIPAVEAVWWAGGVRVTERLAAISRANVFLRSVRLTGAHLSGEETVKLCLALPSGQFQREGDILLQTGHGAGLALAMLGKWPVQIPTPPDKIEIGPLTLGPRAEINVQTLLAVQIPSADPQSLAASVHELLTGQCACALADTRRRWAATSSVETGDLAIAEIFDKARFGLAGMIADDGSMDAGIFEYGNQWVRDTSNTALGALHAGHFEIARAALTRMLDKMVSPQGVTMIAGAFEKPDREQFDQMGELLHVLKAYRDWTGDDSLIRQHRELLLALIQRPLHPQFRDRTGMVHNRREFWERTFTDAYELAYQTYLILGLRDAADLAPALGAEDRAAGWRREADRTLHAMLSHPTCSLVSDGRLIKRRKVTGEVADYPDGLGGFRDDVPMSVERHHKLMPDATMALPIALGLVDPRSDLARRTLDDLEALWNTRWSDGGYDRYHTSGQPDQPGPWTFATTFILRAQHDAGLLDRSRRSLEWLNTMAGGRTGAWLEEIPAVRSQEASAGILPWTSAEVALFVVRHYLGVRFDGDQMVLRPALYPGSPTVKADLRFHGSRLQLVIDGAGPIREARINNRPIIPTPEGTLRLPRDFQGGRVVIHLLSTATRPESDE